MQMSDIYLELGMVQLGECSSPENLDNGDHPSKYGLYSRDCEGCERFEALETRKPVCCGNCNHWVTTDQYE